jgi:hypothetical protein
MVFRGRHVECLALQAVSLVPKFLYRYGGGDFALTGFGPKALLVSR